MNFRVTEQRKTQVVFQYIGGYLGLASPSKVGGLCFWLFVLSGSILIRFVDSKGWFTHPKELLSVIGC